MEDEVNNINIKIQLTKKFKVDNNVYTQILTALNNELLPVTEITLNDEVVFDNKNGFTNK